MNENFYILVIISIAGIGVIITGVILLQVRNQNKLLQKQQQLAAAETAHQKALLQAVITSQEAERQRIGSDLHDEVGTVLSSLRMLIEKQNFSAADNFTNQSKTLIDRVIKNVRQISHNLSPHISGNFGLHDALHELCDTVNHTGSIHVSLHFNDAAIIKPPENTASMALYRVIAELINNTIKHAQAETVTVTITAAANALQINYADDGIGFTYNSSTAVKGMGLQNIESRLNMIGAAWQIPNKKQKGFSMRITVPLQVYDDAALEEIMSIKNH